MCSIQLAHAAAAAAAAAARLRTDTEAVGDSPSELTGGLTEQHYSTATRGERLQGAVRAAGEGPYVISRGGGRGSGHLAYSLELPADAPGEAQEVLGIQAEGSFVLSAKVRGSACACTALNSRWMLRVPLLPTLAALARCQNPANKGRGGAPSAGPQPSYSEEQEQLFGSNAWCAGRPSSAACARAHACAHTPRAAVRC